MSTLRRYLPILKTARAELKALCELADDVKDFMTPILELTRSRKTKTNSEGDINQQLQQAASAFPDRSFILDLTGHPKHRNAQIRALQTSANGYARWTNFLRAKKAAFPNLIPVLQINDEDVDTREEFYDRLRRQVRRVSGEFDAMVYRLPIGYEDVADDLTEIGKEVTLDKLVAVVDAGFIPQNKAAVYATSATETVERLARCGVTTIAVAGSSFPQNPTQYGGDEEGVFNLEEVLFFERVRQETKRQLIYGDYATIHPEPSLQAGGRGWVPRIDLPCETSILYRRSRKNNTERTYTNAYIRAGRRVASLPEFATVSDLNGASWGIDQIQLAADGHPPALSPSHWISARINIHIGVRVATI